MDTFLEVSQNSIYLSKPPCKPLKKRFLKRNILCGCSKKFTKQVNDTIYNIYITSQKCIKFAKLVMLLSTEFMKCDKCEIIFAKCKCCGETSTWDDLIGMVDALAYRMIITHDDLRVLPTFIGIKFPLFGKKYPSSEFTLGKILPENELLTSKCSIAITHIENKWKNMTRPRLFVLLSDDLRDRLAYFVRMKYSKNIIRECFLRGLSAIEISSNMSINTLNDNLRNEETMKNMQEGIENALIENSLFTCSMCENIYAILPTEEMILSHLADCKIFGLRK